MATSVKYVQPNSGMMVFRFPERCSFMKKAYYMTAISVNNLYIEDPEKNLKYRVRPKYGAEILGILFFGGENR